MRTSFRVLLVEDTPEYVKYVTYLLSSTLSGSINVVVDVVSTVVEAITRLKDDSQPKIDIALLDLTLPNGRGIATIRTLRASAPVPIYVLTADESKETEEEAFKAGARGHMRKSEFTPERTQDLIREMLHVIAVYEADVETRRKWEKLNEMLEKTSDKVDQAIAAKQQPATPDPTVNP